MIEEDLTVLVEGRTGVTWFLGTVEGTVAGRPFAARLRYTRTWIDPRRRSRPAHCRRHASQAQTGMRHCQLCDLWVGMIDGLLLG